MWRIVEEIWRFFVETKFANRLNSLCWRNISSRWLQLDCYFSNGISKWKCQHWQKWLDLSTFDKPVAETQSHIDCVSPVFDLVVLFVADDTLLTNTCTSSKTHAHHRSGDGSKTYTHTRTQPWQMNCIKYARHTHIVHCVARISAVDMTMTTT